MATVRWTQRAEDDPRAVHDFMARDSPRAGEALVERVLTVTERLALFPESGRVVPEFPELGYREVIVSSYRVLYRFEGIRSRSWLWFTAGVGSGMSPLMYRGRLGVGRPAVAVELFRSREMTF